MNLIRDILNRIEEEHQAKLRQLDSIKVQQDSFFTAPDKSSDTKSQQQPFDPFKLNESLDNNTNQASNADLNKNFSTLSLDEKERLAFQKEQAERLKSEQMLMATSPTNDSSSKS